VREDEASLLNVLSVVQFIGLTSYARVCPEKLVVVQPVRKLLLPLWHP
jgi:hypothetical protein